MIQNTDPIEPKFVESTIQSNVSLAPIPIPWTKLYHGSSNTDGDYAHVAMSTKSIDRYYLWSTDTDTGVRHDTDTDTGHDKIPKKGYGDTTRNIILLLLCINKFIKSQSSDQ